ncbi:MAG: anti-sigma factor [Goleter apudmare HA4340-LM2]|jgi:anti-sigma-K factor RskA|nr:anti-sigma factor [Goleter apudmare HA4340-LM2]
MTDSFSSESLEELVAGYVLGDLDSEEVAELEQLIAQNPELVKEIAQLQEVMALIPYELPEVQPSPALRSAILASAQTNNNPVRRQRWFSLPWGQIVAALVALAFGIDSYRLRQELQYTHTQLAHQTEIIAILQQPNSRLVALKGVDASTAAGNIVLAPNHQKFFIFAENLSRLPENQIYRLWAVVDGKKIACGQFNATLTGTVLDSFPLPSNVCSLDTAKLVVTQEPVPSPPQPVGSPVLVGESKNL